MTENQEFTLETGLAARIAAVMMGMSAVKKEKTNKHADYKFASVDDVYHALRPLMAENQLQLHIDVTDLESLKVHRNGKDIIWLKIVASLWLVCPEGKEEPVTRHLTLPATGPQAYEAAISYLSKQFLRQRFLIETGEFEADEVDSSEAIEAVEAAQVKHSTRWSARVADEGLVIEPLYKSPDEIDELPDDEKTELRRRVFVAIREAVKAAADEDKASVLLLEGVVDWYNNGLPDVARQTIGKLLPPDEDEGGDDDE